MQEKKLKAAVIGTGMGRFHIEAYSEMPNITLEAVCDLNLPEAQYFADKYGAKTVVADYRELLSIKDLDVISIASPNNWHAPMVIDALKAGMHVLCEKPMTITYQDALTMARTAESTGKRLMVDQSQRFSADAQMLKYYQEQGEFGDVFFSRVSCVRRKGMPVLNFEKNGSMGRGDWFIKKAEAGGGCLYDIGIHLIDLGWYLMGMPQPVAVVGSAYLKTALPKLIEKGLPHEVDDLAAFQIRFENDATLQGVVTWDAHVGPDSFVQLFGSQAGASLFPAKIYRGTDVIETVELQIPTNGLPVMSPYAHFIECVRHPEKEMIASGAENVTMIRMLNAIQKSAETGKEIRFDQ